jgi:putative transposase
VGYGLWRSVFTAAGKIFFKAESEKGETYMQHKRKTYTPSFKAKVVLEAIRDKKTSAELADRYKIHPVQVRNWKVIATRRMPDLFTNRKKDDDQEKERQIQSLNRQVDQLQKELNWLRQNLDLSHKERVSLIKRKDLDIAVCRQAELLGISRSSVYYQHNGTKRESLLKDQVSA